VSDEELRQLERAALADPGDVEAGWRHALALERAGDRRGRLTVLGRLARLGDEQARSALRDAVALPPPGARHGPERACAPLRAPWRVTSATVATRGQARPWAATEERLFLLDREGVVAVDTKRLVERWRRTCPGTSERYDHGRREAPVALRGEELLLGEGSDLLLLDGATGGVLARAPQRGAVEELAAEHDRAVALVGANQGQLPLLVGLELATPFGREVWRRIHRRSTPGPALLGIHDGLVFARGAQLAGLRIADGREDAAGTERARRLDDHGLLSGRSSDPAVRGGWSLGSVREPTAAQERAVEVRCPAGGVTRIDLPPLRAPSRPDGASYRRALAGLAIADGAGYVVSLPYVPTGIGVVADLLNVVGIELASARVFLDADCAVDLHGEFHDVAAIALEEALLLVVTTPERSTLVRFEVVR
jgi:hypothetical protein